MTQDGKHAFLGPRNNGQGGCSYNGKVGIVDLDDFLTVTTIDLAETVGPGCYAFGGGFTDGAFAYFVIS